MYYVYSQVDLQNRSNLRSNLMKNVWILPSESGCTLLGVLHFSHKILFC